MERNQYIGSSDARDILYGSWYNLWAVKTGRAERPDLSRNFKVQLGVVTEAFHLRWLLGASEGSFTMAPSETIVHPRVPWCAATPDAFLTASHGSYANVPVEVKHSSGRRSMDDLIDFYMPQLQHHMMVTGADRCAFSVIRGNDEPELRWVGASPEWHATMQDAYAQFWHYVETDTPPPVQVPCPDIETPPPPPDIVPIDGFVKRDATGDNQFMAWAAQYLDTAEAAAHHDEAKAALKKLVKANEREVYVPGLIELKRDKRGALRIKVLAAETRAA